MEGARDVKSNFFNFRSRIDEQLTAEKRGHFRLRVASHVLQDTYHASSRLALDELLEVDTEAVELVDVRQVHGVEQEVGEDQLEE